MGDRRWRRIKELFQKAAQLPAEERAGFLEGECAGDAELRAEIESLLEHDSGTAIESVRSPLGVVRELASQAVSSRPRQIGPYRLIETIGAGGMGEVWRAEQIEPVRRFVAVKIVRPGLHSRDVIPRFEGERQALARMDHPNVARFYDAGETSQGEPFFVMELVDGETIVRHCERRSLSLRSRLELFADVCSGVQHAHHKALIHRDLKPSNILVTEVDGEPVPKIIDFGIAKAIEDESIDRTALTQLGVAIGTPHYMSPEQAAGEEDIDSRTDVFSLGVVLYQLLTGTLPLENEGRSPISPQLLLERLQSTEPEKPSRRVDDPESRRALRGELDWICMRALEKDRARRYQSPGELRDDIRRYLAGEAVSAGPPSTWYRLRKTIRRHRAIVAGIAATFLVLLAGVVVSTVFGLREAAQRREAVRAQADLQSVVEFLSGMLSEMDTEGVGDRLMEDLLDRVRELRRSRGEGVEEVEAAAAALETAVEGVNTTDAALRMIDEEILARALDTLEERFSEQPLIDARLRETIGYTYAQLGLYPQAEATLAAAAEKRRRLLGDDDPLTLESQNHLANLYLRQGRYAEGEALHAKVLEARRRIFGDEHRAVFFSLGNLARAYQRQERYADAERLYVELLETQERVLGAEHPDIFWPRVNLASVYEEQGRFAEAERLYLEILERHRGQLGTDHPDTLTVMNNLAVVYSSQKRYAEAESLQLEILAARRRVLGDDHPDTLESISNLTRVYYGQGRLAEAEQINLDSWKAFRRVFGADHPETTTILRELACLTLLRGDRSGALDWLGQIGEAGAGIDLETLRPECPDSLHP